MIEKAGELRDFEVQGARVVAWGDTDIDDPKLILD
jgi:hypothetical protein